GFWFEIRGEDDIVELLWNGQVVRTSQPQRPSSGKPSPTPPILRGSGSGSGEENAPLPLPLLQPPRPLHHQNLFIREEEMSSWLHYSYTGVTSTPATHPQSSVSLPPPPPIAPYISGLDFGLKLGVKMMWWNSYGKAAKSFKASRHRDPFLLPFSAAAEVGEEDEMASWLYHPLRQDYFSSGVASTSATRPQSSASLAPTPPPPSVPYGQIPVERRTENFMNFLRLRGNIFSGGRVEAGPVVIESTQIGSSATPSSSAAESCVIPATHGTESRAAAITGVSRTFAVPGLGRRGKEVATETAGTSYSGVNKAETERVQIQPERETKITEDKKREETIAEIQGTEEAHGSTSRKRSRAADMHNLSERVLIFYFLETEGKDQREDENSARTPSSLQKDSSWKGFKVSWKINANLISHVLELITEILIYESMLLCQMMSMGHGMMPPMMHEGNTQQFMPHMAMGMKGMNRPPPFVPFPGKTFPRPGHMAGVGPSYPALRYPFPDTQASDLSRVHVPSLHSNPVPNQPRFPAYINPYSQFVGLHQMQQPPLPLQVILSQYLLPVNQHHSLVSATQVLASNLGIRTTNQQVSRNQEQPEAFLAGYINGQDSDRWISIVLLQVDVEELKKKDLFSKKSTILKVLTCKYSSSFCSISSSFLIILEIPLHHGFKLFFETRGEDDIVELLCKIGQTQIPSSDPLPILRGSGSGGREENTPLPPPLPHQNLFIQEDEMSSWPHHPLRQDYLCSELYASTPAPHPQSSVSLAPPPPKPPSSAPYGQIIAPRSAPRIQVSYRSEKCALMSARGTEEARGSTSRKRSRAAEMHNLAERVVIFPLHFQDSLISTMDSLFHPPLKRTLCFNRDGEKRSTRE
ncbi:putative protein (fragment), partial [Arabidopsis thaliana]